MNEITSIEKMLDRVLDHVDRPVAEAHGLPNTCYTDADYLKLERERVFAPNWACIGFGKDLPNKGDYKPVELLGLPLLILRDQDDQIKVFHNVCSHRGMILVEKAGNTKGVLRCPYHSWCYSLNGELAMTPHVGGPGNNRHDDVDPKKHGLREVRSAVWMDVIFINLDGKAEPFEQRIAPMQERWKDFLDVEVHHTGEDSSFSFDVNCNWKLAVENYCESYHLPWIHPGLNSYSRLEDHYHIIENNDYSGQGSEVFQPLKDDNGKRFPRIDDIDKKWDTSSEYTALYPNVLLGIHNDHFFAIQLEPKSINRTVEHVELYYLKKESTGDDYADLRKKNAESWHEVFAEDIFVVEGMQKGRNSEGFDGGVFSPAMDTPTHAFHIWVARQLAKAA